MLNEKVYGVIGIKSIMSNWNADFDGYPKRTSSGNIFGSDKALKYAMRRMWNEQDKKVLYFKSMKISEKKGKKKDETDVKISLIPRTLEERYLSLFSKDENATKIQDDAKGILKNIFSAVDVKNFGATFPVKGCNLAITGAVQIGQGFNKYEYAVPMIQNILSPFRDGKEKTNANGETTEAESSSLGTQIITEEAHYFYPFVINPNAYKDWETLEVTDGYTEDDYKNFKEAALKAVTMQNTCTKTGCSNEFALFVETDPNCAVGDLAELITFRKDNGKNIIDLSKCFEKLKKLKDQIKNVEVYYDLETTELKYDTEITELFGNNQGKFNSFDITNPNEKATVLTVG